MKIFDGKTGTYSLVALLLLVFAAQCILSMRQKSVTSDEVPHLTAGYSYLKKGDYRLNTEHPPLIKLISALPLMFIDLDFNEAHPGWKNGDQWSFGEEFINNNRISAKKIVFLGRLPMVLLSVILGFLIFKWASQIYGIKAGLLSLLLYSFSPNMLANARMISFDLGNTLFTVLALYTFYHFLRKPDTANLIFSGLALGLALSSKITAFNIFLVYAILIAVFILKKENTAIQPAKLFVSCCLIILISALVVLLTYRITSINYYFDGLKFFMRDIGKGGRPTFLFGNYSTEGWFYYFLAAIMIKTPIPALLLILFSIILLIKRKKPELVEYFLLIPVILLLTASAFSKLQRGLRYVLQIYPFLFILAGSVVNNKQLTRKPVKVLIGLLLLWYSVSALRIFPHYLPYFNELVAGPGNGYKYMIDSNLDWGQDLPSLKTFLEKEGNPEVILSFFGTAAPERTYGIKYQNFYSYNASGRREEHINSLNPSKEFFVISANSLQCLYYPNKEIFNWLKNREPYAVIGHTLFIYDITNDWISHKYFGIMYLSRDLNDKARREFSRALAIKPSDTQLQQYIDRL